MCICKVVYVVISGVVAVGVAAVVVGVSVAMLKQVFRRAVDERSFFCVLACDL